MIDSFLKKVFSFSKAVAALIVFLCVITMIFAAGRFLVSGPKSVATPDFGEIAAMDQAGSGAQGVADKSDYKIISDKREVEKKYGKDIQEIVSKYGFSPNAYDIYIRQLSNMDKKYRSMFVNGLEDFLHDGKKYIEKQGAKTKLDLPEIANAYDDLFDTAVEEAESSEAESKAKRATALITIGSALGAMILFLIIPLLLQIEINTRPTPSA